MELISIHGTLDREREKPLTKRLAGGFFGRSRDGARSRQGVGVEDQVPGKVEDLLKSPDHVGDQGRGNPSRRESSVADG